MQDQMYRLKIIFIVFCDKKNGEAVSVQGILCKNLIF